MIQMKELNYLGGRGGYDCYNFNLARCYFSTGTTINVSPFFRGDTLIVELPLIVQTSTFCTCACGCVLYSTQ